MTFHRIKKFEAAIVTADLNICEAFAGCAKENLDDFIRDGLEREVKKTLAFFIEGKEVSDQKWCQHYNDHNPNNPIRYVGQLFEQALIEEGIIHYGHGIENAHTKNLISIGYDKLDRSLSKDGITVRIRHGAYKDPETNEWHTQTPDVSAKFPVDSGDTSRRFEYEKNTRLIGKAPNEKILLSFLPIIEDQVSLRYHKQGARAAMGWLAAFIRLVGTDFKNLREKNNINCRRSQPYAVMYTRKDPNGNLIRDDISGKPKLYKPTDCLTDGQKLQGYSENRIVYMYCLDVNRFYSPHRKGHKVGRDIEIEREHQDKSCPFTPGSICSSSEVSMEELRAFDDYLESLETAVMHKHGFGLSKLSGMNKDARADAYINAALDVNPLPELLTLKGELDTFVLQEINGITELMEQSLIVRKVCQEIDFDSNILPIHPYSEHIRNQNRLGM